MTKQELLNAINNKFTKVLEVRHVNANESASGPDGVNWYMANVFDATEDNGIRKNISFYVVNEGKAEEAAFWQNNEPKADVAQSFREKIEGKLNQAVVNKIISTFRIDFVDETNGKAIVTAWVPSAGKAIEKHFCVDKDGNRIEIG